MFHTLGASRYRSFPTGLSQQHFLSLRDSTRSYATLPHPVFYAINTLTLRYRRRALDLSQYVCRSQPSLQQIGRVCTAPAGPLIALRGA